MISLHTDHLPELCPSCAAPTSNWTVQATQAFRVQTAYEIRKPIEVVKYECECKHQAKLHRKVTTRLKSLSEAI